jgi:antirestriction protein
MISTEEYRIYVACLAAYNEGTLYGDWIVLNEYSDIDTVMEKVSAILAESPAEGAEEWAVHALDGVDLSGEPTIEECIEWVRNAEEVAGTCGSADVWRAYSNLFDGDADDCQDRYQGEYRGDTEFAEGYADSTGLLAEVPDSLQCYFDYEAFARCLMMDYSEDSGYYFSCC